MKNKILMIIALVILAGGGFLIFSKFGQNIGDLISENKKGEISNESQNFTHPDLGFSFTYPPKYNLSIIDEALGESILIQKEGTGMQLYITDFSGTSLNSSLVKRDITDVNLENVMDITLPSDIPAVSFSYKDVSLGEVWNVWFVKSKKIYQLTSQTGHDEALKMFVESIKFD